MEVPSDIIASGNVPKKLVSIIHAGLSLIHHLSALSVTALHAQIRG